jgi:hypothetical protein
MRMNAEFGNRQIRGYIIVAAVFLIFGVVIGMNLQSDPSPYMPPEPEPTSERGEFDPTLAILAGLAGSITVLLIGGYVLMRRPEYRYRMG